MSSSLVGKHFTNFREKATGKNQSKMTVTLLRQYSEKQCRILDPSIRRGIADHLNHSEKAAEAHYFIYDKRKKVVGINKASMNMQRGVISSQKSEKEIISTICKDKIICGKILLM